MLCDVTSEVSAGSGEQVGSEERSVSQKWVDSAMSPTPASPAPPAQAQLWCLADSPWLPSC